MVTPTRSCILRTPCASSRPTGGRDGIERSERRHDARRPYTRTVTLGENGNAAVEQWVIHGAGHAWSGGSPDGSHTDPKALTHRANWCDFF